MVQTENHAANEAGDELREFNQQLAAFIATLKIDHRVLLGCDEPLIRQTFLEMLAGENILADVACNCDEAEDFLARSLYTAVLLDWELPGERAGEILATLKSKPESVEVLVILRHCTTDLAMQILKQNAYDYFPWPLPSLAMTIAKIKGALAQADFDIRIQRLVGFLTDLCKTHLAKLDSAKKREKITQIENLLFSKSAEHPQTIIVLGPPTMANLARTLGYMVHAEIDPGKALVKISDPSSAALVYVPQAGWPTYQELARAVRRINPDVGLLLVGQESQIEEMIQAIGFGPGDYILRPLEGREFLPVRLERLLRKQRRILRYRRVLESLRKLNLQLGRLSEPVTEAG